jgi:hypothetical protein
MYHLPPKSSGISAGVVPPGAGDGTPEQVARALAAAKQKLAEQGKDFQETGSSARRYARVSRRIKAVKKIPVSLRLPPLPKLKMTTSEWTGTDTLKSWAGCGEDGTSKGKVEIEIHRAPGDNDDVNPVPPPKEMVAAYAHLKSHEEEVTRIVLDAFRTYVNETLIKEYELDLEPAADNAAVKRMVEIQSVHPQVVAKDGMAYLGLFFQCTWDEEHAAGVLLHGPRVVVVGDHEAAHDEFAALKDGGERIAGW